jgi:hypothetical protein
MLQFNTTLYAARAILRSSWRFTTSIANNSSTLNNSNPATSIKVNYNLVTFLLIHMIFDRCFIVIFLYIYIYIY